MAITVLPCLFLSGWFPTDGPLDMLAIAGHFMVSGALVWGVMYLVFAKIWNKW